MDGVFAVKCNTITNTVKLVGRNDLDPVPYLNERLESHIMERFPGESPEEIPKIEAELIFKSLKYDRVPTMKTFERAILMPAEFQID